KPSRPPRAAAAAWRRRARRACGRRRRSELRSVRRRSYGHFQLRLLDLPDRVPRQLVDERHRPRDLEARQARPAVLEELVLARRGTWLEDDEGDARLAPALVRDADDGGVGHVR